MDCFPDGKHLAEGVAIAPKVYSGEITSLLFSIIALKFNFEVGGRISKHRHGSPFVLSSRQGP
jgi:hypothetical protein